MELRIDLQLVSFMVNLLIYSKCFIAIAMVPNWMLRLDKFLGTIHLYSMVSIDSA